MVGGGDVCFFCFFFWLVVFFGLLLFALFIVFLPYGFVMFVHGFVGVITCFRGVFSFMV